MNETAQDASPRSVAELREQIAKGNPKKWGAVETSDKAFIKWMRKEIGGSPIKRLFGRMSRPFRKPTVKA